MGFVAKSKKAQKNLSDNGELVITRRQEALYILQKIQMSSARNGTDDISMEDIDAEIAAYRQEKK